MKTMLLLSAAFILAFTMSCSRFYHRYNLPVAEKISSYYYLGTVLVPPVFVLKTQQVSNMSSILFAAMETTFQILDMKRLAEGYGDIVSNWPAIGAKAEKLLEKTLDVRLVTPAEEEFLNNYNAFVELGRFYESPRLKQSSSVSNVQVINSYPALMNIINWTSAFQTNNHPASLDLDFSYDAGDISAVMKGTGVSYFLLTAVNITQNFEILTRVYCFSADGRVLWEAGGVSDKANSSFWQAQFPIFMTNALQKSLDLKPEIRNSRF